MIQVKLFNFIFKNLLFITGSICYIILFVILLSNIFNYFVSFLLSTISLFMIFLTIYLIHRKQARIIKFHKSHVILIPKLVPKIFQIRGDNNNHIIFIDNGKQIYVLSIFRINAIPRSIQINFIKFIRSMAANFVKFFVVFIYGGDSKVRNPEILSENLHQNPVLNNSQIFHVDFQFEHTNLDKAKWKAEIMYGCYLKIEKPLNSNSLIETYNQLDITISLMNTILKNTFPHAQISILKGSNLINFVKSIPMGGITF